MNAPYKHKTVNYLPIILLLAVIGTMFYVETTVLSISLYALYYSSYFYPKIRGTMYQIEYDIYFWMWETKREQYINPEKLVFKTSKDKNIKGNVVQNSELFVYYKNKKIDEMSLYSEFVSIATTNYGYDWSMKITQEDYHNYIIRCIVNKIDYILSVQNEYFNPVPEELIEVYPSSSSKIDLGRI